MKGLNIDDVNLHDERVRLFDDFNNAWASLFQCQKDMLEETANGRRMEPSQSIIPVDKVKRMVNSLIRLADQIEKFGLVDYQYGVAEEVIVMSELNFLTPVVDCL